MRFAGNRFRRAAVLALVAVPFALSGGEAHAVHIGAAPQEASGFAALRAGAYDDAVRALRGAGTRGERGRAVRVGDGTARDRGP